MRAGLAAPKRSVGPPISSEMGRERHQETGEPAWEEEDRLDDPPGTGKRDPDAAPEILGGV